MRHVVCGPVLSLILLSWSSVCAGQAPKTPPKELIQYVREAGALGLKDADIQQYAMKAGWSSATIEEAVAYVRARGQTPDEPPTAVEPTAPKPAPAAAVQPVAVAAPSAPAPDDGADKETSRDGYRIGGGDILQISVWKEPEASVPRAVVRPDGRISLPLLKDVEVSGLTPAEAERVITTRLAKLIPAADVTVVVTTINSKKIYVVGAVKKEGPIPYTYRMTVMQALSEAGGLSDYAKRKKIYILRTENGKEYRLPFDYDAVLRGERMALNVPLLPNDTLVVPN